MDRGLQRTAKGMWIRTIAVAIFDALIIFAIPQLVANQSWTLFGFLLGAAMLVNWAYLSPRASASRWLTPGLILMAIFVVYPVFYTFYVSSDQLADRQLPLQGPGNRQPRSDPDGQRRHRADSAALGLHRHGQLAFLIAGGEGEPFFGTSPAERL